MAIPTPAEFKSRVNSIKVQEFTQLLELVEEVLNRAVSLPVEVQLPAAFGEEVIGEVKLHLQKMGWGAIYLRKPNANSLSINFYPKVEEDPWQRR